MKNLFLIALTISSFNLYASYTLVEDPKLLISLNKMESTNPVITSMNGRKKIVLAELGKRLSPIFRKNDQLHFFYQNKKNKCFLIQLDSSKDWLFEKASCENAKGPYRSIFGENLVLQTDFKIKDAHYHLETIGSEYNFRRFNHPYSILKNDFLIAPPNHAFPFHDVLLKTTSKINISLGKDIKLKNTISLIPEYDFWSTLNPKIIEDNLSFKLIDLFVFEDPAKKIILYRETRQNWWQNERMALLKSNIDHSKIRSKMYSYLGKLYCFRKEFTSQEIETCEDIFYQKNTLWEIKLFKGLVLSLQEDLVEILYY